MMHLMTRGAFSVALAVGFAVFATGCGNHDDHAGHDHDSHSEAGHSESAPHDEAEANVKPYTLKTCVVSGEELGSMGKVKRFVHEGQEIKLCCKGCEKDFKKDPGKFIKMIAAGSGK